MDDEPELRRTDDRVEQAIRTHFYEWSGGFPPESKDQITVYVDYARNHDEQDVRDVLEKWMNEETAMSWRPSVQ